MFEFLKTIANKIGSFFTKTVPKTFHAVSHWVHRNIIKPVTSTVSHVVKAVHTDARDIVSGGAAYLTHTQDNIVKVVDNTVKETAGVAKTIADDAGKAVSSLAMPLAIGGAAVAIFILMKK